MKICVVLKNIWARAVAALCLLIANSLVYADGIIPISDTDQTASGNDFATTIITIIQKDILPILELGGGVAILFYALSGLWKGFKEYQREKDMDPLKGAIVSSVVMIVVGGAILWLLDQARTHSFN